MASTGANSAWPGHQPPDQHFSNMNPIGDQDFSTLLDLDSFDSFDFLNFDPNNTENGQRGQSVGLDMSLLATAGQTDQNGQSGNAPGPNMFDFQSQMSFEGGQGYQQNGGQHMHQMVPPTPNSVEMHGDATRYLQQMDAQSRAILEHRYQISKEAMSFTPLGTPAVTPHESQFNPNTQEYTVPGAYFSPLISPALEGQNQRFHQSAGSASTASPIDLDIDMGESAASLPKTTRKSRRQSATGRATAGRKVAQSPIQKAQRRKPALSSVIPPKEVSELLEMHQQSRSSPNSPLTSRMPQRYSSSESISPEPLSEGLMGPPPKPHSAMQSPAMIAHSRSPMMPANGTDPTPATPASLMRIQSNNSPSVPMTIHEIGEELPLLDDLILPEAAAPDLQIDTAVANGELTPRMSVRKGPRSATMTSTPTTAHATPIASNAASPTNSAMSPISSRRPEIKSRLSSKKRGSVSSSKMVSPALRPRISPSIKPLLPDGAQSTEEAQTLLLTNRSNYQNLIDGMTIPGVTFPSDLPSQLTSKRTSHKIAEQGRRQRINVALVEMQGLLPKMSPVLGAKVEEPEDEGEEEDDGMGGRRKGKGGGGNSKAATVESAIVYIKKLQDERRQELREREEREREVEGLRRRLEEMERLVGERGVGDKGKEKENENKKE